MSEQFEHNPGDHEDPEIGSTWMVGLVGTIVLIVIVLALTAMHYNIEQQQVREKQLERDISTVRMLRQTHREHLERWWVDEDADRVGVPIEHAMELVVEEYGSVD